MVLAVALAAAPAIIEAGPSSDNLLELANQGGPSLGLGFGVLPLHWELIAAPESMSGTSADDRFVGDLEPRGKAVSLDVKLRWPTAELPIEPYVVLGPALFVERPHDLSSLMAVPSDPTFRVGAKAGAGFNWRLSREATLFGSYDVTTTKVDGGFSSPGSKAPATNSPTGYDLLYGVRFRY
jgi:hypothetical protein